ncbi:MAG TPA: GspH/FimT family pseudopilin [Candidatus Krumholzibacteria bacterium]|nr:GspH/FimT family pseudopilin [Candidatus Krumholzibacteria bacterium]
MKTWQRARGRVRGFTLTELMIVISIMGVLLAITTPALSRFAANWRLNGATSDMAMVIRSARSTAVNKDISVVFIFDQDAGSYYYFEDLNGDGSADAGERTSGVQELPAGVTIEDYTVPQSSLTFSNKGSTQDGGTIVMRGKGDREVQIRVFSGTGNVSVENVPQT